jgi:monoamine oxidase
MLPVDRAMLHQRMPGGSIMKVAAIYDEPFWRSDGLTGLSASPGTAAPVTIDGCTASGNPGILCVIVEGPNCRRLGRMSESDRRQAILSDLAIRFGPKAANPAAYHEHDWTLERYSGGGMLSHAPTGVLTEFGPALRAPCGRIHWAGTESSPVMCGWVDGAVRSGERVAHEILDLDLSA